MRSPRLVKRLGQHHLVDRKICRPLVEYLRPEGVRVLEVGPGGGVLTEALSDAGARVAAVELDPAWAFELSRRDPDLRGRLAVADALALDWRRLPAGTLVAGNLPYGVATAIVARVAPLHGLVPRAAFLVQLEVARRLVAGPGGRDYGALSVTTAAWARAEILGRVRPGSFRPPPKVESAFVGLAPREPPVAVARMPRFERLVRLAFSRRRKTVRNALGAGLGVERAAELLAAAEIDPGLRAERLSVTDFVALLDGLAPGELGGSEGAGAPPGG